jgi:hypothetical protein
VVETQHLLASSQSTIEIRYPIIENIYLSYNLLEHYFSSFKKKGGAIGENVVKGLIMLEVQSVKNSANKLPIFIAENFINYYFYC